VKNMNEVLVFIKAIGYIAVITGVVLAGIKMVIRSRNPEGRSAAMSSLMYIAIGSIIIGSTLLLTNYFISVKNNMVSSINQSTGIINTPTFQGTIMEDSDGNLLLRMIDGVLNLIYSAFQYVEQAAGFKSISELVFNINEGNLAPFTDSEWTGMSYLYGTIASLVGVLIMIMIGKTGIEYVIHAGSVDKRAMLSSQIMRWFYCIFAIAAAPTFLKTLFTVCNSLTGSLYSMMGGILPDLSLNNGDFVQSIKTGNVLTTSIVKLMFVYIELKLNILFMVRKIMLLVLYAFTPIVAVLWGINEKIHASMIWFGEMLTNAVMQFAYAFVFFVMVVSLGSASFSQWFYTLLWMFSLITIAEMIRNSLQGLFARLSGVDEVSIGIGAMGAVNRMITGTTTAFRQATKTGDGLNTERLRNTLYGGGARPYQTTTAQNNNTVNSTNSSAGTTNTCKPPISGVGQTNSVDIGGKSYQKNPLGLFVPTSEATSSSVNAQQAFSFKGKKVTSEEQKKYKNADEYYEMLINNINRQMLHKDIGQTVSGALDFLIGHDQQFSTFAQGVGNRISGVQRKINIWKAINETVEQITKDSDFDKKQAMQELFNSNSELQTRFRQIRLISSAGKGHYGKTEKILASWHPYTRVDGFTWKA